MMPYAMFWPALHHSSHSVTLSDLQMPSD